MSWETILIKCSCCSHQYKAVLTHPPVIIIFIEVDKQPRGIKLQLAFMSCVDMG